MNAISFRVLFVCVFLPSIMYVCSIQLLEHYLQATRTRDLQNVVIQDFTALYNGRHGIRDEIAANIAQYLKKDRLRPLGVSTKVVVTTRNKRLLYPAYLDEEDMDFERKGAFDDEGIESFDYIKVAEQNFRILNDGILVSVEVKVRHNSWLTNSILVIYLFASILFLYWYIKRRLTDWAHKREDEQKRIAALSASLAEHEKSLAELSRKERDYIAKIEDLNSDKEGLQYDIAELKDAVEIQKKKSLEIDEVLEEMELVEEEAKMNMALKEEKEHEIAHLREEIDRLRSVEKQGAKKRKKDIDSIRKRFNVIYKNVSFHERALEGYALLTPDFQLKAEELIHKLNEDDSLVTVKRKVFSKKGKLNTLEATFSYSGRLYFKKADGKKTEVVAIGTKNSQEQDLHFLESIS